MHALHVVLDLSFHQNEDFSSKRLFFSSWIKQFISHLFFCCCDTFERKKKK
jgi:hypothetical protein